MLEELKILSDRYADLCKNKRTSAWTNEDKEFVKSAIKDAHSIALNFCSDTSNYEDGITKIESPEYADKSFDFTGPCLKSKFQKYLPAYEAAMKNASILDPKFETICKKDVNPLSIFEYNWMQSAMSNALARYATNENAKTIINACKEKFEIYRNENRWLACFNGTGGSLLEDCKKFEQELQINAPKDPKLCWEDSEIKSISSKTIATLSEKELELFKEKYVAYKKAIGIEEDKPLGLLFYSDVDFTFLERNPESLNISTIDDVINAIKKVYEQNIPIVQPMKATNNAKEVIKTMESTLPKINAPMPSILPLESATIPNVNANMIGTNMENDTAFMQHLRDLLMIPMYELKNKDTQSVLNDLDCKQLW